MGNTFPITERNGPRTFGCRPVQDIAGVFRTGQGKQAYRLNTSYSSAVSGCCPSCAFHAQSVTDRSVNTAVKLDFSGLQA